MEIRLHGRGGQGGVTCAKLIAAIYAGMGRSVQAFGDYAGERSGAPIRAYARIADAPITNRNKVYEPDHLVVLDPSLLNDATVAGLRPGGTLLVNSPDGPEAFAARFPGFDVATVDATAIARRHGIGSRSVVIVNTTIAGAFAKVLDVPLEFLDRAFEDLHLAGDGPAAHEAWADVRVLRHHEEVAEVAEGVAASPWGATAPGPVPDLVMHLEGPAPTLKTGAWRSQMPEYVERLAPCSGQCPAGNDVIGFAQALATRGVDEAAKVLARSTPFAGVCGRVCPGFCMQGCNRRFYDGAVDTRGLERWIADHAPEVAVTVPKLSRPSRVAVIGSGPAGLTAAYHVALHGHAVTVYDREAELGGVLRTGIPEYRLPREVLDRDVKKVLDLGVEVRTGHLLDAAGLADLAARYDAVIVATGLQRLRGLDVDGARLDGVQQGIDFLAAVNSGEQTGIVGDVFVLGGGNTAMDCARTARRLGAGRVVVAYRRTRAEMPAIAEEVDEAIAEGVEFLFQVSPAGFFGQERVSGIELAEVELGPKDASGRRSPVVTDRSSVWDCDAVLLALGQSADRRLLPEGWALKGDRLWDGDRPLPVFACGDLATNEGTVAHAIGHGRRVASLVLAELGEDVEVFRRPDVATAVKPSRIRFGHFDRHEPAHAVHAEARVRSHDFREANLGLPDAADARRCVSCGHCTECDSCLVYCPEGIIHRQEGGGYRIDLDYCKGCGICVTECPRGAIEMVTP